MSVRGFRIRSIRVCTTGVEKPSMFVGKGVFLLDGWVSGVWFQIEGPGCFLHEAFVSLSIVRNTWHNRCRQPDRRYMVWMYVSHLEGRKWKRKD